LARPKGRPEPFGDLPLGGRPGSSEPVGQGLLDEILGGRRGEQVPQALVPDLVRAAGGGVEERAGWPVQLFAEPVCPVRTDDRGDVVRRGRALQRGQHGQRGQVQTFPVRLGRPSAAYLSATSSILSAASLA
jgi:hypothetical protein